MEGRRKERGKFLQVSSNSGAFYYYTLKGLIQKCFENQDSSNDNDKKAGAMMVDCMENSQPTSSTCEDQDMVDGQLNGVGEAANPVYVHRHRMASPSAVDDIVAANDLLAHHHMPPYRLPLLKW